MIKKYVVFIILIISITGSFILTILKGNESVHTSNIDIIKDKSNVCQVKKPKEMRGIWVSFIDLSESGDLKNEANFNKIFDEIVKKTKSINANTLIVQIRPFCDSLYKSSIFPVSHIFTGKQGEEINFDPLEYMIKKCHENDLLIEGWINPLRIKTPTSPSELSNNNPAKKWLNSDYVLEFEGSLYLNPAHSEVRKLIIDGVKEIVSNYDIDGIHFDDYFYPTMKNEFDEASYNLYLESLEENDIPLTLNKWRTANISSLISGVYSAIKNIDPSVVFGISPQGNIENCINMGADVYSWCSQSGYVDYICPQIYFNFEHKILPFDKTLDKWKSLVKNDNISLYVGLGLYKAQTDTDNGTWLNDNKIIEKEISYGRENEISGFFLYSFSYLSNFSSF